MESCNQQQKSTVRVFATLWNPSLTQEKISLLARVHSLFQSRAAALFTKWTNWRILQEEEESGNRNDWNWYAQPVQSLMIQMHHPMDVHWESKGLAIIVTTLCACMDKLERWETGGNSALRLLRGTQVGLQSSQDAGKVGDGLFLQHWGGEVPRRRSKSSPLETHQGDQRNHQRRQTKLHYNIGHDIQLHILKIRGKETGETQVWRTHSHIADWH